MNKILYASNANGKIAIGYKDENFLTGGTDDKTISGWRCDPIKKVVTATKPSQLQQGISINMMQKIKGWFILNINNLHKFEGNKK